MSNYIGSMKKGNMLALMSRIREKANRLIVSELEKKGIDGIVPSHGEILMHLFLSGTTTMNDLAQRIHRSRPTVTVLVDKLTDFGYVTREKSTEDSRVTFIALTEKGRKLKPVFDGISKKLADLLYQDLSDEQCVYIETVLSGISERIVE